MKCQLKIFSIASLGLGLFYASAQANGAKKPRSPDDAAGSQKSETAATSGKSATAGKGATTRTSATAGKGAPTGTSATAGANPTQKPARQLAELNTPNAQPHPAEKQLLVAFKDAEAAAQRSALFAKYEATEVEKIGSGYLYLIELKTKENLKTVQEAIGKEPGVRYAEPNTRMHTFKSGV